MNNKVLVHKLHIEHIPIAVTPAPIFLHGDRVRVGYFLSTRFLTGEILCQREAVFLSVLCHIVKVATAVVVGLYDGIYIGNTFTFR